MHKKAKEYFDTLKWMSQINKPVTAKDLLKANILEVQTARRAKDVLDGLVEYFGYDKILKEKNGREYIYKLLDKSGLLFKILNSSYDLSYVISNINELHPTMFNHLDDDDKNELKRLLKEDKNIFIFKSFIIEDLEDNDKNFAKLKQAIKNRKYQQITFKDNEGVLLYKDNKKEFVTNKIIVKPLKLIFIDNNWYLAIEDEESRFGLVRISFIKNINDYEFKDRYQRQVLDKYKEYFKNLQNSMTLYNVEFKTAKLKANKNIKKYFKKEMKKFFPSQKFISEDEDGVVFSINYTQPLEILPFIKKWLPNIEILQPQELKDELKKDLQKALEFYK
jgi:predicted DNA-binding transcriptional regulator YafY